MRFYFAGQTLPPDLYTQVPKCSSSKPGLFQFAAPCIVTGNTIRPILPCKHVVRMSEAERMEIWLPEINMRPVIGWPSLAVIAVWVILAVLK